MKLIALNPTPPDSPVNGADLLAILDRRLAELSARDNELLARQIEIESTPHSSRSDANAATMNEAQAILHGEKFNPSPVRPMAAFDAIVAERAVIKRAQQIGNSEKVRIATELAGDIWASYFPDISKIEKRRIMLARELQSVNQARERLREKIVAAGGAGLLPTDSSELLGFAHRDDEVSWASERLIADNIATRSEINKASRNCGSD